MINYVLQIEGQNLLQVVYNSGYCRYIDPDQWGDYYPNMSKTQKQFMKNAIQKTLPSGDSFGRSIIYWLDKDKPNLAIISAINSRNKLKK